MSRLLVGFVCLIGKIHLWLWNGVYFRRQQWGLEPNDMSIGIAVIVSLLLGIVISNFHQHILGLPITKSLLAGLVAVLLSGTYFYPIVCRILLAVKKLLKGNSNA